MLVVLSVDAVMVSIYSFQAGYTTTTVVIVIMRHVDQHKMAN